MEKIIHETYITSKDNYMIEWGYCFKAEGFEDGDCVLDDLVLGEANAKEPGLKERIEKSWAANEAKAKEIAGNNH